MTVALYWYTGSSNWHFVTDALTSHSPKYSISGIAEKGRADTGLMEQPFPKAWRRWQWKRGKENSRKSYTWEETGRANDKNSCCQNRQNLTSDCLHQLLYKRTEFPEALFQLKLGRYLKTGLCFHVVLLKSCPKLLHGNSQSPCSRKGVSS